MISKANWSDFSNVDTSTTLATLNRVMPPWVSVALVILIAWQIAKIVWMLVPAPAAGDAVDVPAGITSTSTAAGGGADVASIAENHMFGEANPDDGPALDPIDEEPEDLPPTRKNLVLKGTIASDLQEFSVAVIEVDNAAQKVYAVGDSLGSGATLDAVYRSRVVLNENGARTILEIPTDFPVSRTSSNRRSPSTTRQSASDNRSIQSVVSQNLSGLTEVIRPTPYIVNGEQVGYRVYPGRNRQQFAALGLRPGDLIKDIDGQSLTDPAQAVQVFETLGTAEQVTLTVERNGEAQSIILKTSQLDLDGEQTQ